MPDPLPRDTQVDKTEPSDEWPSLGQKLKACPAGPIEHHSQVCPNCSERLQGHRCKLVCPRCGYYLSCSDYY